MRGFFQANRHLLRDLVTTVVRHADGEGPVVDLYSGVGLYAVGLASVTRRAVVAVEGDRWSIADLETNAATLERSISVRGMPVEDFLVAAPVDEDATLVLNPPRTGMSPCARREVTRVRPTRIVYVSCDVATLVRDVRTLLDGGYESRHVEAFDLFPNTAHIETVVVLARADA